MVEPVKTEPLSTCEPAPSQPSPSAVFNFPNLSPVKNIPVVKTEIPDFPVIKSEPDFTIETEASIINDEIAMKEQDNAVAALLKQEEEEAAKVNEYIKNEEDKASVLLFDEFDHHERNVNVDKTTSDYLLTPESYNVALHSAVNTDR